MFYGDKAGAHCVKIRNECRSNYVFFIREWEREKERWSISIPFWIWGFHAFYPLFSFALHLFSPPISLHNVISTYTMPETSSSWHTPNPSVFSCYFFPCSPRTTFFPFPNVNYSNWSCRRNVLIHLRYNCFWWYLPKRYNLESASCRYQKQKYCERDEKKTLTRCIQVPLGIEWDYFAHCWDFQ